ncbi:chromosome partitioning protein ParB [Pseudorhodobacter sp. E13]|uniref:ParB/RepB/Spo0J family partition protein n=1 Tax=Pseudorhodobacter sp. E13 TaxID=2487931 RepID=UPI000F8DA546|nr:ParB/RepB/Spo0J family partition protein [Pseudorhodobacter sp. E13]RUS64904.1 chromosome partitioning protein ParB [Pseudorhodobacter sp. E13]
MKAPVLQSVGQVPVADIEVSNRLRPISEAGVESLLASIAETGVMKDAIHLRRKKSGVMALIAGGHRLEAAKRLGWETIEAKVWTDVTDDWAQLMEIDDNLAGAEMCALDNAIFLARRKEVYERLHPEAKQGGDRKSPDFKNQTDTMSVRSFAAATAEKFGLSERHVRRMISAGSKMSPKDVQILRSAPQAVSLADLMEISKADPAARYDAVELFAAGKVKRIGEAIRLRKAAANGVQPTLKDPVEEAFKALSAAWARAPMAAKRRFVDDHAEAIAEASKQ